VAVRIADLRADDRWPQFRTNGIAEGIASSVSVPMLVGTKVVGAVNLYSRRRHGLGEHDLDRAGRLADHAAGAVALALRLAERENETRNLAIALESRSVIDQAMGILMVRAHVHPERAFEILRKRSQDSNIKLRDVAAGVVAEFTTAVHPDA
jgi:GAF domain-containing protein